MVYYKLTSCDIVCGLSHFLVRTGISGSNTYISSVYMLKFTNFREDDDENKVFGTLF